MPFEPPPWAAEPSGELTLSYNGNTLDVDKKPWYIIGRDKNEADILLEDEFVSRRHAAIVHHQNGLAYLIDLMSSHGTFINGEKIAGHRPMKLHGGERLQFGSYPHEVLVQSPSAPKKYRASHLLVKHRDVRNPKSWKENPVTRSREEAQQMIDAFRAQLAEGDAATLGERFAQLASQESHCSSAKRGGDLGWFEFEAMMRPFSEATAAVEVGAMSPPVETDSGVHIILRTG